MCLAVPGQITSIEDDAAAINMLGVTQRVSLRLTPEAQVGDYVLVHAGFAIQIIDAQEAEDTIELLRELDEITEQDLGIVPIPASATSGA